MSVFEAEVLRVTLGGRWVQRGSAPAAGITVEGVGIDTRESLLRRAFFAIKGANHDAHAFLADAVRAGAALLIVERASENQPLPPNVGVIKVNDTRRALAKLALAHRRALAVTKVIAITGSAGKTTTKRLIHAVLAGTAPGKVTASSKSFNNDIGVPLTILSAKPTDKFLILEIGSNAPGEVMNLASIAEPDLAVITSIGRSHLQGLGSIEAVAREKASLLSQLGSNGIAIVTADAPLLRPLLKQAPARILFGESDDADLRLTARGGADGKWWFEVNERSRFEIALPGKHNALNALAAVALGRRLGMDDDAIARGLASVQPEAMRMEPRTIGPWTIWNDAYNANPESMLAALATFAEVSADASHPARRIVVLGDMLELGDAAIEAHRELGSALVEIDHRNPIAHAVFLGPLSRHAADEVAKAWGRERVTVLDEVNATLGPLLVALLRPGDALLIKGSRGMALERLIETLGHAALTPPSTAQNPKKPTAKKKVAKRRAPAHHS